MAARLAKGAKLADDVVDAAGAAGDATRAAKAAATTSVDVAALLSKIDFVKLGMTAAGGYFVYDLVESGNDADKIKTQTCKGFCHPHPEGKPWSEFASERRLGLAAAGFSVDDVQACEVFEYEGEACDNHCSQVCHVDSSAIGTIAEGAGDAAGRGAGAAIDGAIDGAGLGVDSTTVLLIAAAAAALLLFK